MNFLYPFFLLLLPLVLLPLILFLGTKGKKREILFSTLFLLKSKEFKEERLKQKFRLWLLIVIRILMLLTVILLLARPRNFGKKWGRVYYDASFSMQNNLKTHRKDLKKLLSLFGKKRLTILNTFKGGLFVLDTTYVPEMSGRDVFYTDGRVPYLPSAHIVCDSGKSDSWVYVKSVKQDTVFLRVKTRKPARVYIFNTRKLVDSVYITPENKQFYYVAPESMLNLMFRLNTKDGFPEDNECYYRRERHTIPVKLTVNSPVLNGFFNVYPFNTDKNAENCVAVGRIPEECVHSVVFVDNNKGLWHRYYQKKRVTKIKNVETLNVQSGVKSFLLINTHFSDTSSLFYDPDFILSFSSLLERFFAYEGLRHNLYIKDFLKENCNKQISGITHYQGFFVCKGDTIAVSPNPIEFATSSICKEAHTMGFKKFNGILLFERLLVLFLVFLVVLETLLVYFL